MGQIADDMLNGSSCDLCGEYFKNPNSRKIYVHDHPATCWECWDELTDKEKKLHQKSEVETH